MAEAWGLGYTWPSLVIAPDTESPAAQLITCVQKGETLA